MYALALPFVALVTAYVYFDARARDSRAGAPPTSCPPRSSSALPERSYIRGMANYLHTMLRVTDPEQSRAFYETLGMEFRRQSDIVRDGAARGDALLPRLPG